MLTCDTYFMNKTVNVYVQFNGRIDNFKGIVKDTNQGGVTILVTESQNPIYKKDRVVFLPFGLFTMTADAPSEQVHACINDLNEMYPKKPHLPPAQEPPV